MPSIQYTLLRALGHADWVRRGIRDRTIRLACDPERGQSCPFTVPFYKFQYRGDLASYIDWNVYFYGAYEKGLLRLVEDIVVARPGAVVFDIGANVGHHALAMAGWATMVHAFEPYPAVARLLSERVAENPLANIRLHPFGLGERNQLLEYFAPTGRGNLGTGSFVPAHATGYNERHGQLEVRHGDAVVEELGLDRLDFVKLDVEGFEHAVLLGLRATLERFRPAILMELSAETQRSLGSPENLRSALPTGYVINAVATDRPLALLFNRPRYRLVEFDFEVVPAYLLMQPEP